MDSSQNADLQVQYDQSPQIDIGTVGWDDQDTWFEQGAADNDGYTLVRVQLFRGRDRVSEITPGLGQGHKLLCHISSSVYRIPAKGTRVYVAIPVGMEKIPGAGVIIATVEKSPTIQFRQGRVKMDFPNEDLVIKAKSVTISDYSDNYAVVGPDTGVRLASEGGCLVQVKDTGITNVAPDSITLLVGSNGGLTQSALSLNGLNASLIAGGSMFKLNGLTNIGTWIGIQVSIKAGSIALGTAASPATPASIFPSIPSTTVFLQP